jgi:hypothetical protein
MRNFARVALTGEPLRDRHMVDREKLGSAGLNCILL